MALINIRDTKVSDAPMMRKIAELAVTKVVDAPEHEKPNLLDGVYQNIDRVIGRQVSGAFLAAEGSGGLAGFILVKNYWNLSDLFVAPEHQGRGIGNQLWKAALANCLTASDRPSMRVNSSLNAVSFYESLGFLRVDVEQEVPEFVVPLEYTFTRDS